MTVPARPRRWREVQRCPVQGNSPNDRNLRGPDCYRPKRVCADAFPATPSPQPPRIEGIPRMRFSGMTESIGPMCSQNQNQNHANLRAGCRLPLVGPRAPVKGRDGRTAPHPSSTMSSGRLFLDRVARQHCPSPLHRHGQNNMHPLPAPAEQDISTLQRIGHFYFALTCLDPATLVLGSSGPINLFLTPAPHGCIVKMDGDRSKRLRPQDPDLAGMSQDGEYVIPHWG